MRFNVYTLTYAKPNHCAAFANYADAKTYAEHIRLNLMSKYPIFIVEGWIEDTLWGAVVEDEK